MQQDIAHHLDWFIIIYVHNSFDFIHRWWREIGFVKKLRFARDRLVQCYFWSLGVHFEPEYSQGRLILTKMTVLTSVMDDMFNAYGTLEELQLFTDVIKRFYIYSLLIVNLNVDHTNSNQWN